MKQLIVLLVDSNGGFQFPKSALGSMEAGLIYVIIIISLHRMLRILRVRILVGYCVVFSSCCFFVK